MNVSDKITILDDVSFKVEQGKILIITGPNGGGKSTLAKIIMGIEKPTSGQILFGGKDIAGLPPYKREVNTVFQKYALFPHLNVFNNVAFGLKLKKVVDDNGKEIKLKDTLVKQIVYDKDHNPTNETKLIKKTSFHWTALQQVFSYGAESPAEKTFFILWKMT